jgi:hypothetical protein
MDWDKVRKHPHTKHGDFVFTDSALELAARLIAITELWDVLDDVDMTAFRVGESTMAILSRRMRGDVLTYVDVAKDKREVFAVKDSAYIDHIIHAIQIDREQAAIDEALGVNTEARYPMVDTTHEELQECRNHASSTNDTFAEAAFITLLCLVATETHGITAVTDASLRTVAGVYKDTHMSESVRMVALMDGLKAMCDTARRDDNTALYELSSTLMVLIIKGFVKFTQPAAEKLTSTIMAVMQSDDDRPLDVTETPASTTNQKDTDTNG